SEMVTEMSAQRVILVAEDEPALVEIFRRALAREGYVVLSADDGRRALEVLAARSGEVGLVLSDVVMPGRGGRELVWRLRATHPHIKVILASGYADAAGALQMIEDHGIAFVAKPVDLGVLVETVKQVLGDA